MMQSNLRELVSSFDRSIKYTIKNLVIAQKISCSAQHAFDSFSAYHYAN